MNSMIEKFLSQDALEAARAKTRRASALKCGNYTMMKTSADCLETIDFARLRDILLADRATNGIRVV